MTLDWILYIIAIAATLGMLVRSVRTGVVRVPLWIGKCVIVLAVAAVSPVWRPHSGYWLTVGAWAVLIAAPSFLGGLAGRCAARARYGAAHRLAWGASLLHPFDGWRFLPAVMAALDLAERGAPEEARAALARQLADPRVPRRLHPLLRSSLSRLDGDWERVAAADVADAAPVDAFVFRLRALGETGRLAEMVAAFDRRWPRGKTPDPSAQLFLLAFSGRVGAVGTLLLGPLAALGAEAKAFWIATAELAAGEGEAARARLTELARRGAGRAIGQTAERRLSGALADPRMALGPEHRQVVAAVEAELRGDAPYRERIAGGWRGSVVILVLAAVNIAVYGAALAFDLLGREDALLEWGAMWPEAVVTDAEWWRLVTATFLHLNLVHLAFNMLALLALGPWVERMLGHVRVLIVYMAAGIGSMAGVLLLIEIGWVRDEALVGASGAIFGLVGAQLVLLAQGWRQLRSRLAARRLRMLGAIILMQTVFDLLTPQVSWSGHAWGLVIGAAVTALLAIGRAHSPGETSPLRDPRMTS